MEGALTPIKAPLYHLQYTTSLLVLRAHSYLFQRKNLFPRLSPGAVTSYLQPLLRPPRQPQPQKFSSSPLLHQPHSPGPPLVSQPVDQPTTQSTQTTVGATYCEFVNGKIFQAFGDSLAKDGSCNSKEDVWVQYCRKVVAVSKGSIGRQLIDLFAEEIICLSKQSA